MAAVLGACSDAPRESVQPAASKPNILLIMSDDLGYEAIGCYGGTSYKTPNVDRLAATGVRFTHAYAQPLCTPTRMQLMTGQYNFRNWKAFGVMDPSEVTIGHTMQQAGYRTCIAGKWQLYSYNPPDFEPEWRGKGMPPEQAGFDDWYLWHARHTEEKGSRYAKPVILDNGKLVENTEDLYGPDLYTAHINQFMENHVHDHADQPFFVYYPMALTHGPFPPTPHSADWATGDARTVAGRVFDRVRPGGVVLLHERFDGPVVPGAHADPAQVVDAVLGGLVARGWRGLSVEALVGEGGHRRTAWFRP